MAYNDTLLADEEVDVLMMNPDPEDDDADFGDEGSGATSGYGDLTEDDLSEDDDEMLAGDVDDLDDGIIDDDDDL